MTALAVLFIGKKKSQYVVGQIRPFDDGYDYAEVESDLVFSYAAGRVPIYTRSIRPIDHSNVERWPMPQSGIEVKKEDYWFDFTYKKGGDVMTQ